MKFAVPLATVLVASCVLSRAAEAQVIDQYLPTGVPGFGEDAGLPVLSRPRPLFEPTRLNLDGYDITAGIDESVAHDSNVDGIPHGPGSWIIRTAPAVQVERNGTRNQASVALSIDDERYLDQPGQNQTNLSASLGDRLVVGRGTWTAGYAHYDGHEITTALSSVPSSTAIPIQVDDVRAGYSISLGRFTISPTVEDERFSYGAGTLLGARIDESILDRNDLTAGVTTRYGNDESRGLVLVLQDVQSNYRRPPPGVPDNSASSQLALAGIDYQSNGLIRYRLLAGVEHRTLTTSSLPATTTPIVEAEVIYVPTGLTTVTASAIRRVEDATSANVGSYTYSRGRVAIDHELRRNVLLRANADVELAEYALGGTQTSLGAGAGATYLFSPRVRVSADYTFTHQGALSGPATVTGVGGLSAVTGQYDRSIVLLTLHLSL